MKRFVAVLSICILVLSLSSFALAKTKIVVWKAVGELDALVADFNKSSTDVEVELVNPGSFYDKVLVAAAAGTLPDITMVNGPSVPAWYQWLLPLDKYIDQATIKDWMPVSREEMYWKGNLWAVPVESNTQALAYNRDVFRKQGVPFPDKSWTWDDLIKVGSRLTIDRNGDGQPDQWGFYHYLVGSVGFATWLYLPWIQQLGAEMLDNAGNVTLNQPATVQALQFMRDLYATYRTQPLQDPDKRWQNSEVAMAYRPATQLNSDLVAVPDLDVGAVIFPKPVNGTYAAGSGGWAIGISRDCKNVEAAVKFIQFFAGKAAVGYLATKAKLPPIAFRQTVMRDILQGHIEIPPGMEKFPYEAYADALSNGKARPRTPLWPEIEKVVGPMFQQAFTGQTPVGNLAESTAAQLKALLAQKSS